jgi:hypothetical protein
MIGSDSRLGKQKMLGQLMLLKMLTQFTNRKIGHGIDVSDLRYYPFYFHIDAAIRLLDEAFLQR